MSRGLNPIRWYVRVFEDGDTIHCGSDSAVASRYVRRDCVRDLVNSITKFKKYGKYKVTEVYQITDQQFWDLDWYKVDVLRKHGKLVWKEYFRGY